MTKFTRRKIMQAGILGTGFLLGGDVSYLAPG